MANLIQIVTVESLDLTVTVDALKVVNIALSLADEGKAPQDLSRSDLRRYLRTVCESTKGINMNSTRQMRTILAEILGTDPGTIETVETVETVETIETVETVETVETTAQDLLAVVEKAVETAKKTRRGVSQTIVDRFSRIVDLGDPQDDGTIVVTSEIIALAGWSKVYHNSGMGWGQGKPGGKAALELGYKVRTTSKGDLGFRLILTPVAA